MKDGALKVLFLVNGLFVFASSLLGPLYAVFVQHLHNGILTISISWAVFLFSTTGFNFIVSKIGDHKRKDYLLIASFLIRAVVWILFIFISSVTQLIILQIVLGAGEAFGNPSFDAIFAEHLDKGRHIEEYADWQLIMNVLTGIATVAGGLIVTYLGFKNLFILMSFLAILSTLGVLIRPKHIHME